MERESGSKTKSDKFYQMKIAVLERELSEKTRILENTSSLLADSQKQYQHLLRQLEKIKKETGYRFDSSQDHYSSEPDFIMNTMKSRERHSYLGQPLQQLQDFEITVKQLSSQMNKLKSQNNYYRNEQKEWNNFAISNFNMIRGILPYEQDFPENDGEAQRYILDDLFNKLYSNFQRKEEEENMYRNKYNQAKIKLCEVQKKCDKMLMLLEENGVDFRSNIFNKSTENINENNDFYFQQNKKHRSRNSNGNFDMNSLGNHLDQLTTITKQMKKHYQTIRQTSE
ncbi:hypothetical protein M9Y10_008448 [Tritrichomonas musculus]|uniref:Uncharacterized protein n=1 Tax=Tritrichomonas musculus TaxID=1915356 RepID=A0ABR2IZY7_9EUKA